MDRLVRERGSVGRRIWRRRRKRATGTSVNGDGTPVEGAPHDGEDREDEGGYDEGDLEVAPISAQAQAPRGFFGKLKNALMGKPKPPPADPPYLIVDPTREVLAVPRGAARLDAFERTLASMPKGAPQLRALALAFHKELSTLAESAGVDLSLLESRVEACARALIDAGEDEKAGALFLRVGRRHQAAELFVAAGAIDALEEAHAQITWEEGGAKHEARMSFERFEALYVVGLREQALEALEKAKRLWRDNPIYAEVHASFIERLGAARVLPLSSGKHELIVVARWPVVVGRGEEAGVRLTSPLLSRAHLQIELGAHEGKMAPIVVDLDSRGGTRVDGLPLKGKQALRIGADIDMGGVVVKTHGVDGGVLLWAALAPERRTLAVTSSQALKVPSPHDGAQFVTVKFDARGHAVVDEGTMVNGERSTKPTLLLEGDKIGNDGWHWTVARHRD